MNRLAAAAVLLTTILALAACVPATDNNPAAGTDPPSGVGVGQPTSGNSTADEQLPTTEPRDDGMATLAKYNKIKNGVSYAQVKKIMGSSGTELSRAGSGQYETVMYMWKAADGVSNMNVTFQGNKVLAKAQFGLP